MYSKGFVRMRNGRLICLIAVAGRCLLGHASATPEVTAVINSVGMKMVRIEPGWFLMGSEQGDWDEQPVHTVTISRPFRMAATEVTNKQYEMFDPAHRKLRGKHGFSMDDDEAVVFVSWQEAVRYCEWLSDREGRLYRLPTEAEWEYACRAGTSTAYSTGEVLADGYLKGSPTPPKNSIGDAPSLSVGQTPPNAWGLHDMHGNVEEWCADWYGPYQPSDCVDPIGYADGDFRVTRGGSHSTSPQYLRSANRLGTLPEERNWLIGFRVVRGDAPTSRAVPVSAVPLHQQSVKQGAPSDLTWGSDSSQPYFRGPREFVKIPDGCFGPLFSKHNHCPSIVECPNGDLLAVWYSCIGEGGREMTVLASRLRHGDEQWQPASLFWDAPDRNEHTSVVWSDCKGTLYHFNGLTPLHGSLALILRTSTNSGATWSKARILMPEHGQRKQVIPSVIQTYEGTLILPCDALHAGGVGGTAVHLSTDGGMTWTDSGLGQPTPRFEAGATGSWIAGIHAGVVQLRDGRLMALGREDNIDGRMPMSISVDGGRTWTYCPSPFPPIGGGKRLALLRLREGPILLASFANKMTIKDAVGQDHDVTGLFAALSFDEGRTWPARRLVTDGGPARTVGAVDNKPFTLSATSAEHRGYLAVWQACNGIVHLISSRQHYAFNLKWLKAQPEIE